MVNIIHSDLSLELRYGTKLYSLNLLNFISINLTRILRGENLKR